MGIFWPYYSFLDGVLKEIGKAICSRNIIEEEGCFG